MATYCFSSKKISKCLFNAICLLEKYPGNVYLTTLTGRCFNELYEKQKAHYLNNIAELPSPFKEKNYNTLLEFIGRLSLTDIGSLGYHFLNKYSASCAANKDFLTVLNQSKKNYEEVKK